MMYRNTNESYGEPGPLEAPSKEFLADEMADTFAEWAAEKVQKMLGEGHEFGDDETPDAVFAAEMRAEFIPGLIEA
jgi:hypothetical protein